MHFPFQIDGGVVIEDTLYFEQEKILEDLLADCVVMGGIEAPDKGVKKRPKTASTSIGTRQNKNHHKVGKNELQKAMHRDLEKQRRQEMAALCASIRSFLPLEYIKGKRSMSDHMHQAVNYIKHMQNKIREMEIRRDKLKKLSNNIAPSAAVHEADQDPNANTNISFSSNCVKVNLCRDGMEILVKSSINIGQSFPFSKVLADLLARGLDGNSYVSTRINELWILHKIQIEHDDPTTVDLSELEERLVNVIKHA